MTSVKILDKMGNEAKEKLPSFRDHNNGALLVELCEKAIALCNTYNLYNNDGDWKAVAQAQHCALYGKCKNTWQKLMGNTRNCDTNGSDKHKRICQQLCQGEFRERVYLDQRVAMRAGLKYKGHDHEKRVNKLMIYLAENATKLTEEESAAISSPQCSRPAREWSK